jgi:hypothetical protein
MTELRAVSMGTILAQGSTPADTANTVFKFNISKYFRRNNHCSILHSCGELSH